MEPQVRDEAKLNQRRIEAGEGSYPTFEDEIVPHDWHPDAVFSTPSSHALSGSKRKRTPRSTRMPEVERAGHDDEAEWDENEDLNADLDGQMGNGWSEQDYGGEDTNEFDGGHDVEPQNRQFRSKVLAYVDLLCTGQHRVVHHL